MKYRSPRLSTDDQSPAVQPAALKRIGCKNIFFSTIPRRVTLVALLALVWSSLAFCGEIHEAAQSGDLEKVKALLKGNPHLVFSKDNMGYTPLHWAAFAGHKEVAELLLASEAKVDDENERNATPLLLAARAGHKDVAELLVANKAEVNAKDDNGDTPLHWAAMMGHKDVAELLLINNAEVNTKDNYGYTPLRWAAFARHKDVAELLLANKAEPVWKGPFGLPMGCLNASSALCPVNSYVWVGQNVNDAITRLGQPTQTVPLNNHGPYATIYTFTTKHLTDYYNLPIVWSQTTVRYYGTVQVRDSQTLHQSFWVDSAGIIRQWKWKQINDYRVGNYPTGVSYASSKNEGGTSLNPEEIRVYKGLTPEGR